MSAHPQGKETKLTGKITCAKDVTYYLAEKSGKASHDEVCKRAKDGSATGTASTKDGKQVITVSKAERKR